MNLEDFSVDDKIDAIMAWADAEDRGFDDSYVKSMKEKLADGEELTEGQIDGLDNIITKWKIDVDEWKDA